MPAGELEGRGNGSAIGEVYERDRGAMKRMSAFVTGDVEAAGDLVQDAFADLQQVWDTVEDPQAWLLTERRLLCSGDAATEPGQRWAWSGLSVLDVETGQRNVVARSHDPLIFLRVADDDLARTWTFSMREKWYPTQG